MAGIVLTFPILPGKVEAWRRFCQELAGFRRAPYEISRQRLGITLERMALVETAFESFVVTTLEASDAAEVLGQIITSLRPFDIWYRNKLHEIHGINLAGYEQFLNPVLLDDKQELVFEWSLVSDMGG